MQNKKNLLHKKRESYKTSKNILISFHYAFNGINYVFNYYYSSYLMLLYIFYTSISFFFCSETRRAKAF